MFHEARCSNRASAVLYAQDIDSAQKTAISQAGGPFGWLADNAINWLIWLSFG
jgi:hypothetical protein